MEDRDCSCTKKIAKKIAKEIAGHDDLPFLGTVGGSTQIVPIMQIETLNLCTQDNIK